MSSQPKTGYVMRVDVHGEGDPCRNASIWRGVNCWPVTCDEEAGKGATIYYADNCLMALGWAWRYIETGDKPKREYFDGRDADVPNH